VKRPLLSLVAAIALVALAPAATMASLLPDTLDQSADVGEPASTYFFNSAVTQTVTPSLTGLMTRVSFYCGTTGQDPAQATVTVGTFSSGNYYCDQLGWVDFNISVPVVAGQQLTIQLAVAADSPTAFVGKAAADYTRGAADCAHANQFVVPAGAQPFPVQVCPTDFAFKTYMMVMSTTTYVWSPTSVPAGSATTAALTATTVFANFQFAAPDVAPAAIQIPDNFYTVKLATLPAWFTPTGIICSAQIAALDCTIAKFQAGIHPTGDGTPMTVTVTVSGTAAPGSGASGTTGTGTGQGCLTLPVADSPDTFDVCDPAQAALAVGAANSTPPPTSSTSRGPDSGSGPVLPIAALFLAAISTMFVAKKSGPARIGARTRE
jgi:hypothetical protein